MQKKIKDACHLWRDSVKVPWVVGGVKKVLGPPRAGYRYHSRVRCQCVEIVIIILTGNMLRGTNAITRCTSIASVPLCIEWSLLYACFYLHAMHAPCLYTWYSAILHIPSIQHPNSQILADEWLKT